MDLKQVVVVDAARSAFGRGAKGSLVAMRMDELAANIVKGLLERNPALDPYEIEDVICGNTLGMGELRGLTSNTVSKLAGLPPEIANATVDRQCGSSMQAVHMIAREIMTGAGEVGLALGVERMGRGIPGGSDDPNPISRTNPRLRVLTENQKRPDPNHDQYYSVEFQGYLLDSPADPSMPQTAQNVVEAWNLSRQELDEYSVGSHLKAAQAYKAGRYRDQILPQRIRLPVFDAEGKPDFSQTGAEVSFEQDECIRANTTVESLAQLQPIKGIVSYGEREIRITAGNSCPTNDGAAAVLLMSEARAKELGLKPLARIRSMAVAGTKPQLMGVGTIPASRKALRRAGIGGKDIGLAEINEAFASQSIATVRELGLNPDCVNVNGGAIAIGHPLGASGARLIVALAHEMRRRGDVRYGLATMCIGAGMGIATVLEAI